jgi:hypothetical protein
VWFDVNELALVLERSTREPIIDLAVPAAAIATAAIGAPQPNNSASFIASPLDAADAIGVAAEVARAGAEIASTELFGTILEGALEILGAIFAAIVS